MTRMTTHTPREPGFVLPLLVILSGLAGAGASGLLLSRHEGGWTTAGTDSRFLVNLCESETLPSASCADVVGSRWGSFDIYIDGSRILVPTSYIGLAYFAAVTIWFGLAGSTFAQSTIRGLMVLVLLGGIGASLVLTLLMVFSLSSWCPLCVFAHGCNAILVLAGLIYLWRIGVASAAVQGDRFASSPAYQECEHTTFFRRRIVLSAGTVVAVALAGLWGYYSAMTEAQRQWRKARGYADTIAALQSDEAFMLREFYAQEPIQDWPDKLDAHATDGLPTITLFTDFACKACACFDGHWHETLTRYFGEEFDVEYRILTRDPAEPEVSNTYDDTARAAAAARAIADPRTYRAFHRLLFQHRNDATQEKGAALARRAGLEPSAYANSLNDPAVGESLQQDADLARDLGVESTPTVFVNGRRVPDLCLKSRVFWRALAKEFDIGQARRKRDMNAKTVAARDGA